MKTKGIVALCILASSVVSYGAGMRVIEYERHELYGEPEKRSAELSAFVYDIPYFGACGIFPPFHIANEIFQSGGSEGGMSPGATWEPFQLTKDEYDKLVKAIRILNPKTLGDKARFKWVKFEFDSSFDHITRWDDWLFSVCEKHRNSYHRKLPGSE